jgi:Holliday junction DNA helicase RuvA
MISKLRGFLDTIDAQGLVIDVNGVGYSVACSQNTLRNLPASGDALTLYIETLMRAEQINLYGFLTDQERSIFKLLLTVQGVGGKVCLSLLSALTSDQIFNSILTQDHVPLTQADGVGPKLATRIVRELKDKKISEAPLSLTPVVSGSHQEALSALINLGYKRQAVLDVLKTLEESALDKLIPLALKHLTQR